MRGSLKQRQERDSVKIVNSFHTWNGIPLGRNIRKRRFTTIVNFQLADRGQTAQKNISATTCRVRVRRDSGARVNPKISISSSSKATLFMMTEKNIFQLLYNFKNFWRGGVNRYCSSGHVGQVCLPVATSKYAPARLLLQCILQNQNRNQSFLDRAGSRWQLVTGVVFG